MMNKMLLGFCLSGVSITSHSAECDVIRSQVEEATEVMITTFIDSQTAKTTQIEAELAGILSPTHIQETNATQQRYLLAEQTQKHLERELERQCSNIMK